MKNKKGYTTDKPTKKKPTGYLDRKPKGYKVKKDKPIRYKKVGVRIGREINKWLVEITTVLKNVLVFSIVAGLLFNDPFGVINTISNLMSGVGEQGLVGFISLAIIILVYRRKDG